MFREELLDIAVHIGQTLVASRLDVSSHDLLEVGNSDEFPESDCLLLEEYLLDSWEAVSDSIFF